MVFAHFVLLSDLQALYNDAVSSGLTFAVFREAATLSTKDRADRCGVEEGAGKGGTGELSRASAAAISDYFYVELLPPSIEVIG